MSEASTHGRGEHVDNQSVLSASVQGVSATTANSQQNRSSSNAERVVGRTERQRIQRSSSATSDDSTASINAASRSAGRVDVAGGSHVASVASLGSGVSGERRAGRHRRQVIRLPDQGSAQVRQVRRRLPTPEPDTIERVYIQRTAGEIVEEITEIPTTPPPRIQERTVIEPAGPPQVIKRVIRVPPRGSFFNGYQQTGNHFQAPSTTGSAGQLQTSTAGSVGQLQTTATSTTAAPASFGNIQQAANSFHVDSTNGSYQSVGSQPATTPFTGGFSTGYVPDMNLGAAGANLFPSIQQNFGFPQAASTGFPSQQVTPPIGCHPAFCFYV